VRILSIYYFFTISLRSESKIKVVILIIKYNKNYQEAISYTIKNLFLQKFILTQ